MKDYSKEIMSILVSSFSLDASSTAMKNDIPGLSGLQISVSKINRLVQEEVHRLETEIVSLTDLLNESDSMQSEVMKKSIRQMSYSGKRQKMSRYMNH